MFASHSQQNADGARDRSTSTRRSLPSDQKLRSHCLACAQSARPKAFYEGQSVRIFSRLNRGWVDGKVATLLEDGFLRVEYIIDQRPHGKTVHVQSPHIRMVRERLTYNATSPHPAVKIKEGADKKAWDRTLPEQCGHDPKAYYIEMDSIWGLLEAGHVVLIRGDWLAKQSKAIQKDMAKHALKESDRSDEERDHLADEFVDKHWEPLPSRKDLPPEAIVDINALKQVEAKLPGANIVSISHCWLNRNHPDPEGRLLDQIGQIVWCYWADRRSRWESEFSGAFFFAWCSMYQPYHTRDDDGNYHRHDSEQVSPEEQQSFQISLRNMHVWYAHAKVEKWLFTMQFDGQEGGRYSERGWPTWESTVADLLGGIGNVLDFGSEVEYSGFCGFDFGDEMSSIRATHCRERKPPVVPDQFEDILKDKHFTCEGVDRPLVLRNYRDNFKFATSCITTLALPCMPWGAQEMDTLFAFLEFCTGIETFDLGGNALGDSGAACLACVIPFWPMLRRLFLDENNISVVEGLANALTYCLNLETITFQRNQIGDNGAHALANCISRCVNLRELELCWNAIGDAGANAIVRALHHCSKFSSLGLSHNRISGSDGCFTSLVNCPALASLKLAKNAIGDVAARELRILIMQCKQLVSFEMYGNALSDEVVTEFKTTLQNHSSLKWHNVDGKRVIIRELHLLDHDPSGLARAAAQLFQDCDADTWENLERFAIGPHARRDICFTHG